MVATSMVAHATMQFYYNQLNQTGSVYAMDLYLSLTIMESVS